MTQQEIETSRKNRRNRIVQRILRFALTTLFTGLAIGNVLLLIAAMNSDKYLAAFAHLIAATVCVSYLMKWSR